MSDRKHETYTLWLQWNFIGWRPEISASNPRTYHYKSPKEFLWDWAENSFPSHWGFKNKQGDWKRYVRVLPKGQVPK